jgi:dolichol-phosphate mannosyltransferase
VRLFTDDCYPQNLAQKIVVVSLLLPAERILIVENLRGFVGHHSLDLLVSKLLAGFNVSEGQKSLSGVMLKYVISGGIAATVDLFSLYVFTDFFHLWYLLSGVFAFLVAFGVSFTLQKFWTFNDRSTNRLKSQMVLYFLITLINLLINTLLMYFFVDFWHLSYLVSQVFAGILVASESLFLYRRFVFGGLTGKIV